MQTIHENNWLTSEPIDLEYKKYLLLAYDQRLTETLKQRKLYPTLTELVDKIQYVNDFLKGIRILEESAKEVDRIDWLNKTIEYRSKIKDNTFDEIKQLAWFSKDLLADQYIQYKNLMDEIESTIVVSGYRYTLFQSHVGYIEAKYAGKEKVLNYEIYRTISPEPVFHIKTSKVDYNDFYQNRFRKNVFEVRFNEMFPIKESIIPVFRRKLLLHILGNGMTI